MSVSDLRLFEMRRPADLPDVCAVLAERVSRSEPTVLLAGGTDWLVEQETRPAFAKEAALPLVLDVSRLPALRGITLDGDRLRIGAAATYLDMRRDPAVLARAPMLERMGRDIGAIQIQARGTLGGNLATASPAADGVTALAAYDATLVVHSVRGERRIPFASLQTAYKRSTRAADEVIVAVEIDLPPAGSPWIWRKVGTRRAQSISKVALAGVAVREGDRLTRLGLGMASVAPVTALLSRVRTLATSRPLRDLTAADIDAAVDADVSPIDDIRSTRDYRAHCARSVVRAFLRDLGAPV
ncbi:FAD binding domain-containing protein [Chondromyces apiculatus]|uniref:Xanthine dehydrogenase, FAD binding subunit n=1 Tax=Chondromyces apiculatus DSM 436 TaxID=1192034 RepID=A0A017TJD5_9BACT|nr:FAD binding domain-containing protein [Chondromyces apiculatus]EYF08992.1 Xanthine dehydrogenase, FAD binding subunit [Chondromyces apiculatus DSM 436]